MTFWTKYHKEMGWFDGNRYGASILIDPLLINRLLPSMVNILAYMKIWLREKFEYFNRTARRYSQANVSKFVAINVNLELINSGCEWDVDDSHENDDEN
jgi:hypothetical protein